MDNQSNLIIQWTESNNGNHKIGTIQIRKPITMFMSELYSWGKD